MRWKHKTGAWVADTDTPSLMRPRTLDDAPEDAYICTQEGLFLEYDGHEWSMAPAEHGLDLNRNFPVDWAPFSQFGMDGGTYPLSEPESRAVTEALQERGNVCAAVTNHTYTGCILVAPYGPTSDLVGWDKKTLLNIANQAVEGTDYRVFSVFPDFQYEASKPIPGVWASYLVSNVGIPAYTLELWDPYREAGVDMADPAANFFNPDLDAIGKTAAHFAKDPANVVPWHTFNHPQLGEVEIGGLISEKTFRNPPVALLKAECERAYQVAERIRKCLPKMRLTATLKKEKTSQIIDVVFENHGYLSTGSLQQAQRLGLVQAPVVTISCTGSAQVIGHKKSFTIQHLSGWGDSPAPIRANPLFPQLPPQSNIVLRRLPVTGHGEITITLSHERAGVVSQTLLVG